MKDIITKLTFAMGKRMSSRETNELYESKKDDWKYDVVLTYVAANFSKRDLVSKCVQLAKELNLAETNESYETKSYWQNLIDNLRKDTKKEEQKEAEKAIKKITYSSSGYGCGGSRSYGCGGSNDYSYGCGGSRSSFRGC